jgi:hypothetical protein
MTIPQTNFKLGILLMIITASLGADHMKYVVTQDQTANITGQLVEVPHDGAITSNCTYRSVLRFEHTDGFELCKY